MHEVGACRGRCYFLEYNLFMALSPTAGFDASKPLCIADIPSSRFAAASGSGPPEARTTGPGGGSGEVPIRRDRRRRAAAPDGVAVAECLQSGLQSRYSIAIVARSARNLIDSGKERMMDVRWKGPSLTGWAAHCTAPAQMGFRGLDLRLGQLNAHKMFYAR